MVIKRHFNSLFFLFLYLNVILLIIKNILMKKIYFLCFLQYNLFICCFIFLLFFFLGGGRF